MIESCRSMKILSIQRRSLVNVAIEIARCGIKPRVPRHTTSSEKSLANEMQLPRYSYRVVCLGGFSIRLSGSIQCIKRISLRARDSWDAMFLDLSRRVEGFHFRSNSFRIYCATFMALSRPSVCRSSSLITST